MSTFQIVVTILSFVAGLVSQAVNTGSIFGIVTVPKAWLSYVAVFGTFLAGAAASLTQAGSVTGATVLSAFLAGLMALGGSMAGVTVHQHFSASRTNDDGTKKAA